MLEHVGNILKVMELRLDLAYHCKIGILEYSGELEDIRRLQEINEHIK
jgi:hypothetical protein